VQPFIELARAIRTDFAFTDDNAHATADICRRLDGLPLAIELAAARIKVLPPGSLLAPLEQRRPLLTVGRDRPARQQTMRDAIAWSYVLLRPDEQALIRRLAVFAGGFTLEAAAAVAGNENDVGGHLLEPTEALVGARLVRAETVANEPRFEMFETIRVQAEVAHYRSGRQEAILMPTASELVIAATRVLVRVLVWGVCLPRRALAIDAAPSGAQGVPGIN
jgi:predicted ATPase